MGFVERLARPLLPIVVAIMLADCTDTPAQPYNEPLARCCVRAMEDLLQRHKILYRPGVMVAAVLGQASVLPFATSVSDRA